MIFKKIFFSLGIFRLPFDSNTACFNMFCFFSADLLAAAAANVAMSAPYSPMATSSTGTKKSGEHKRVRGIGLP